jgi:hypothetical protein
MYAWIAQEVANIYVFIHLFKMRPFDCYQQEWYEQTSNGAQLELYCRYQIILHIESYLSTVQHLPYRNALTGFRCSKNKLAIETGRHGNVIRSDRICK